MVDYTARPQAAAQTHVSASVDRVRHDRDRDVIYLLGREGRSAESEPRSARSGPLAAPNKPGLIEEISILRQSSENGSAVPHAGARR